MLLRGVQKKQLRKRGEFLLKTLKRPSVGPYKYIYTTIVGRELICQVIFYMSLEGESNPRLTLTKGLFCHLTIQAWRAGLPA